MGNNGVKGNRRALMVMNYLCLLIMNVCFYFISEYSDMTHAVDAVGLSALAIVVLTFRKVHWKTGLWKLTHAKTDTLDERQVQLAHVALGRSYAWFSVICLAIMLVHAAVFRLVPGVNFIITIPLASSLIYLAHTLPGSILAWSETEVPSEAQ
ncbi:MAG: hypothetical protein GY847_10330 [Proteobacteria bacterium]|nr:hypothetical protein [Pseudomonadota bacterium]